MEQRISLVTLGSAAGALTVPDRQSAVRLTAPDRRAGRSTVRRWPGSGGAAAPAAQRCRRGRRLQARLERLQDGHALADDDIPVAGAGFDEWEHVLAHLGVLTVPAARRQGWATRAAAVATDEALDRGLVPQWRARTGNAASNATAARLG